MEIDKLIKLEMDLDDESDDSSSSAPPDTLDQFREKWQQELTAHKATNHKNTSIRNKTECEYVDSSNDQVLVLLFYDK